MVNALKGPEVHPDPDTFLRIAEHHVRPLIVPLCATVPMPEESPLEIYSKLHRGNGFLLESMEGSERIARYSYIGLEPEVILTFGEALSLSGRGPFLHLLRGIHGKDVLQTMRTLLQGVVCAKPDPALPRFFGGLVGYLSYDLVFCLFDTLERRKSVDRRTPLAQFMLARDCLVFDHRAGLLHIFSSPLLLEGSDTKAEYGRARERILAILERMHSCPPRIESPGVEGSSQPRIESSMRREEFCRRTEEMKARIYAGEIFQGVLSRRIDIEPAQGAIPIYAALRRLNPSPYMYLLDFGELQVVGASPEMLLRVEGNEVTTVPIAGTRPRGRDEVEDERLARELLADEKERAEHAMLVDLARNDVGRVSRYGSVQVEDFMNVERFSHVQHLVSTVRGYLKEGYDAFDALGACFPAGTVTGAPKIRAMQIIEELEPEGRGLYAGAVGFTGFDGNLEFAITIRTILLRGGRASVQVGAGIVADSIPEREWQETENKAAAMLSAIIAARGAG